MIFRLFRQMLSGRVLSVREVPISGGTVTLRLKAKQDRSSYERYATLSMSWLGHGDYQHLTLAEFAERREAVQAIDAALKSGALVEFEDKPAQTD